MYFQSVYELCEKKIFIKILYRNRKGTSYERCRGKARRLTSHQRRLDVTVTKRDTSHRCAEVGEWGGGVRQGKEVARCRHQSAYTGELAPCVFTLYIIVRRFKQQKLF